MKVQALLRSLSRHWGFSITIIVSSALAIGYNTAMFGVVSALLLNVPPGIKDPQNLFQLIVSPAMSHAESLARPGISLPDYELLKRALGAGYSLAGYCHVEGLLDEGDRTRTIPVVLTAGDYFAALGTTAALGRFFTDDGEHATNPGRVAVLSYGAWVQEFGSDPGILGRAIQVNGVPYIVIGVAARGFGGADFDTPAAWVPLEQAADFGISPATLHSRFTMILTVIGRRESGMTLALANERVAAAMQNDQAGRTQRAARGIPQPVIRAATFRGRSPGNSTAPQQIAIWLLALSTVLLLISCTNVAVLLLARAYTRRHELGVRYALGATPRAVAGVLLGEGCVLAGMGGLLSLGVMLPLSYIAHRMPDLPPTPLLDGKVLLYGLALTCGASLLSSAVPAWFAARTDPVTLLHPRTVSSTAWRIIRLLPGVQVALALPLLASAGISLRNVHAASVVDVGFAKDHLLIVELEKGQDRAARAFYRTALERLRRLPGVQSVTMSAVAPFHGTMSGMLLPPSRHGDAHPVLEEVGQNAVDTSYFRTMGMRLIAGRSFNATDRGAPMVAVVNQTLARAFWPEGNAVGQCLGWSSRYCSLRVIGVVSDAKYRQVTEPPQPHFYQPLAQLPDNLPVRLLVRIGPLPSAMLRSVRGALADIPAPSAVNIEPFDGIIARQTRPWRLGSLIVSMFGIVALFFATVGLSCSCSFAVSARIPELGVRMALGASPTRILWMSLRQTITVTLLGVSVGAMLVVPSLHVLERAMHMVGTHTLLASVGGGAVLLVAAVIGSLAPALRAAAIDPARTLRP